MVELVEQSKQNHHHPPPSPLPTLAINNNRNSVNSPPPPTSSSNTRMDVRANQTTNNGKQHHHEDSAAHHDHRNGLESDGNTRRQPPSDMFQLLNYHHRFVELEEVFFNCSVQANPAVHTVQWHHDGRVLNTDMSRGNVESMFYSFTSNMGGKRAQIALEFNRIFGNRPNYIHFSLASPRNALYSFPSILTIALSEANLFF